MRGLLNTEQAVPGQTPGMVPMPVPTTDPEMASTPETVPAPGTSSEGTAPNQNEVELFVSNGLKIIHTPKVSDLIISKVADAKNPVGAIAEATLGIVERLVQSAKAAGKNYSFPTVAAGTNYIMGDIIASGEAAGMKKMDDQGKFQAITLVLGKYLDNAVNSGRITKEAIMQMGKEASATPMGQKMKEAMGGGGQDGGIT